MFKTRNYIAFLMTIIMSLNLSSPIFAKENSLVSYAFQFDGITYEINEEIDSSGNKTVTVVGNGEKNIVVNDGASLHINSKDIKTGRTKNSTMMIDYDVEVNNSSLSKISSSKKTLYWNYGYGYSDRSFSSYGMYFNLESGDTYGQWSGFDEHNEDARDLAYEFCSAVRELDSSQWVATTASGASAGLIAAAIAAAGPTVGVGTIIGIVSAILSGGVAISEWIAAYNSSLDCNQIFLRFKQAI